MFAALALVLAAGPMPALPADYLAVVARVEKGETLIVYAGVTLPTKCETNAVRIARFPGESSGVYRCFPIKGEAKYEPRDKPKAVASVKGHSHRCPFDGTEWSHADGDPTASHNCPTCGRQVREIHNQNVAVEAKPAKPVGRPKRIFDGRYYWDEYPDGTRVWCTECNRGR